MDVFNLQKQLVNDYGSYTKSFIKIRDQRINEFVQSRLESGAYWPQPLVQLNPMFERGGTVQELIDEKILHEGCDDVFKVGKDEALPGSPIVFHKHQREAIELYAQGKSYILTSGTGSGKSLTYIVPIVDHVLKNGTGNGIKAIVVYPMNALANSQFDELSKFIDYGFPDNARPVSFARYTGQESDEERKAIQNNPPDILLTNYMMLELLLTRRQDQAIVKHAQKLKFLVFDEIHTYRGRQGADVAMLIRRTKQTLNAEDAICIGTSATMASGKNSRDQKKVVADVAQKMFATEFDEHQVIGETLSRRTTAFDQSRKDFWEAVSGILSTKTAPDDADSFQSSELASWIEDFFGLTQEHLGEITLLKRQIPQRIQGKGGAIETLQNSLQQHQLESQSAAEIEDVLIQFFKRGAELKPTGDRYPIFAFKLHQFFSRGDTVWSSLESASNRHLEISKKIAAPGDTSRLLFPLVFCKECGCEYHRVTKFRRSDGTTRFLPREDRMDLDLDESSEAGFLYLSETSPWPEPSDEADRLPEQFRNADGTANRSQNKWFPERFHVCSDGHVDESGEVAAFIQSNFRFCLNPDCGVTYPAQTRSERAKLLTLGVDTRSTATTILALRTLQELRKKESALPDKAKKLLSFTDNRQDASLQAGHFNDFAQVALIRSALYAVLEDHPDGVSAAHLPKLVFEKMDLEFQDYASNPDTRGPARDPIKGTLIRVIEYLIFRDLMEGWRVTTPNLEQCGLLKFKYPYLKGEKDALVDDDEIWTKGFEDKSEFRSVPEALNGIDKVDRFQLIQVLLDFMRRNLCVKSRVLEYDEQSELQRLIQNHISEDTAWHIDNKGDMVLGQVLYPRSRPKKAYDRNAVYASPLGAYGKFIKRELSRLNPDTHFKTEDVQEVLNYIIRACAIFNIIEQVRDQDNMDGYQLVPSSMLWALGDGTPPHNPLKQIEGSQADNDGNAYFKDFYQTYLSFTGALEAREHTAQVQSDEREKREEAFKSAKLPLLFCSPTMELGVDISQLNVVNLRNVPPTPANYAQRSGRAGRGGQPAFVFTYCAGRSPHDQYYFNNPEAMVAGEVAAPRIDLTNEELLKSHINALWLEATKLDLGIVIPDLLDVDPEDEHGYVFKEDVLKALADQAARAKATSRAQLILSKIKPYFDDEDAFDIDVFVRNQLQGIERQFRLALKRWVSLYTSAMTMKDINNRRSSDMTLSEQDRNVAKSLWNQSNTQIELLTKARGAFEGDFYTYRYFAAEGFLPGYNFPRLPISAFIPGRRRNASRDEFVSRARFLAISEFGPRSLVYHNGKRYQVHRVNMDLEQGEEGITYQEIKRCEDCGHGHVVDPTHPIELCKLCGSTLEHESIISNLVQMQNVTLRLKERITCDEEERQRFGYRVTSAVSFEGVNRKDAELQVNGNAVCKLFFGPTATLWRINRGWSNSKETDPDGFVLDLETGRWQSNKVEEDNESAHASKTARIVPYVQDQKNALLLIPQGIRDEFMPSLQSALKEAIQQVFQVEPMELGIEGLPSRSARKSLLFYEVSEGGAGVLRELVRNESAWKRIIDKALAICHFDPDTGSDLGEEFCSKACYSCLLDYANQPDHQELDRFKVKELLWDWRKATLVESGGRGSREQRYNDLLSKCDSKLEKSWLQLVYERGYHLPSHSQENTPGVYSKPDFEYREEMAAVFIDGPPHDRANIQDNDEAVTEKLEMFGYRVVRFHHSDKDQWEEQLKTMEDIFGKPSES